MPITINLTVGFLTKCLHLLLQTFRGVLVRGTPRDELSDQQCSVQFRSGQIMTLLPLRFIDIGGDHVASELIMTTLI